jgi:hypothetical protein
MRSRQAFARRKSATGFLITSKPYAFALGGSYPGEAKRETNNKYVNFQAESAPPDAAGAARPIGAFIFTLRLASQAMTPDTKDSTS